MTKADSTATILKIELTRYFCSSGIVSRILTVKTREISSPS